MTAAGIIFSNIHDSTIPELTHTRTLAAVPFAGRYRLVDFALSNMVNSNIYNVSIITHYNYQSLMEHIGSGKDWDLARRTGGVKILPPYITAGDSGRGSLHATRLQALKSVYEAVARIREEYVVMCDCDGICNVDYREMIDAHVRTGADITVAVKRMPMTPEKAKRSVLFSSDIDGRITDVLPFSVSDASEADVSLNMIVLNREYLQRIVTDAAAYGYSSLTRDIIQKNMKTMNYRVYRYDGFYAGMHSAADYFSCSMELLENKEAHCALFGQRSRPVYTKVKNAPPTYYTSDAAVKNSMIADGCIIEGTVENSILFRGVRISRGCTVRNSILMQDTQCGENAVLEYVIADKHVTLRSGGVLIGCSSYPYCIPKGKLL